jgi:hypothetical protein
MWGEPAFQVRVQAPAKVTRQSHIIELAAPIQRVNSLAPQDISADNVEAFFERIPADVFKMLADQLRGFSYNLAPSTTLRCSSVIA